MSKQPSAAVHEFELGKRGTVRGTVSEFRGRTYLDIRLWVEPEDDLGGELVPTKKGISLPTEYLDDLLETIQALAEAVRPAREQRKRSRRAA